MSANVLQNNFFLTGAILFGNFTFAPKFLERIVSNATNYIGCLTQNRAIDALMLNLNQFGSARPICDV